MRKRVPQESQATEEVSLTFIQDGADSFEDWLDKKYLDFGFKAPSLSNTWTVQDHMLSVIATKRYIQTVKEKSPINGHRLILMMILIHLVLPISLSFQEKSLFRKKNSLTHFQSASRVIKASAMLMHRMLIRIEQNVYVHAVKP
jgi:hypothetical protein